MQTEFVPAGKQLTIAGPATAKIISGNAPSYTYTSAAPTLTGLAPNTAARGAAAVTVTATGTGFIPTSEIRINGQTVPTQYVSATSLKFTVTPPPLGGAAGIWKVEVVQAGDRVSGQQDFTIT